MYESVSQIKIHKHKLFVRNGFHLRGRGYQLAFALRNLTNLSDILYNNVNGLSIAFGEQLKSYFYNPELVWKMHFTHLLRVWTVALEAFYMTHNNFDLLKYKKSETIADR